MAVAIANFPYIPLALALTLAGHGYRKKSLSTSGSVAAFVVGFTMMAVPLHVFGVSLISFYLVGSRATKIGKKLKNTLEEGHQAAGYRTAAQVLCNSFTALAASVTWSALFSNGFLALLLPKAFNAGPSFAAEAWCPISTDENSGWSRYLLYISLGHFACCLGDTLASEIGILSKSPPILITTLKQVPPGTNGGMSTLGTVASILGGIIMGATMFISLIVQSSACRAQWGVVAVQLIAWGAFGGGVGSLVDSFLGATVQQTRYSTTTKRILQDDSVVTEDVKVISGARILTNNQVNLVSSIITAFTVATFA